MKILFILMSFLPSLAFAGTDCSGAMKVSEDFSVAAVNKKIPEGFAMMDQKQWTREGFEKAVETQFVALLGKDVRFSVPSTDLQERRFCVKDREGNLRMGVNRILISFEGANGIARILPVSIDLVLRNGKWKVTRFASTAM